MLYSVDECTKGNQRKDRLGVLFAQYVEDTTCSCERGRETVTRSVN